MPNATLPPSPGREDFETLMAAIEEMATVGLAEDGAVSPMILLLLDPAAAPEGIPKGATPVVVLPVGELQSDELGDAGKDAVMQLLSNSARRPEVRIAAHLTEAWIVTGPAATSAPKGRSISSHPQREEVVLANMLSADVQAMAMWRMVREDGKVRLAGRGELKFLGKEAEYSGRFIRPRPKGH